jgi:hypothetical protein
VRELPVVLDYQFTGSGVRSSAVALALIDVLAIFYRLRIIRYYQRRRAIGGAFAWTRPNVARPLVSLLASPTAALRLLDYEDVELIALEDDSAASRRTAAEQARGDVLAFLQPESRPSGNWLRATAPFFARAGIDAAVTPVVAPAHGPTREVAAAAISESRVGGGSLHFRSTPGNIRLVGDFPARSFLVRRDRFLALPADTPPEEVILQLTSSGSDAVYVPEASVTVPQAPLLTPYLSRVIAYGYARGALVRRRGWRAVRVSTFVAMIFILFVSVGWLLVLAGGVSLEVWVGVWVVYGLVVMLGAAAAGLRFRRPAIVPLAAAGTVVTHAAYAVSFLVALARG